MGHEVAAFRYLRKFYDSEYSYQYGGYMATGKEVADHLGITSRYVRELSEKGILPKSRGRNGRDIDECRIRYLNHLRERAKGKKENDDDDETDELREEKILLLRSQRQKLDLAYKKETGELLPAEVITFVINKTAPEAAGILDTIPLKVQRRHPDITPNQMNTLQTEIAKAMNAVTKVGENIDEYMNEYQLNTKPSG